MFWKSNEKPLIKNLFFNPINKSTTMLNHLSFHLLKHYFLNNPIVFSSIQQITAKASSIEVEENYFTKKPDNKNTWNVFINTVMQQLMIYGNCFLIKQPNKRFLTIDCCEITLIKEKNNIISYRLNEKNEKIHHSEILHLKINNGISPMSSARIAIESLNYYFEYILGSIQNHGQPASIISFSDEKSPNQKRNIIEEFSNLTSYNPKDKFALFTGSNFQMKAFGKTLQELKVEEMILLFSKIICSAFGIPSILLGLEHSTFNNYEASTNSFNELVRNHVSLVCKQINDFLKEDLVILK